MHSGVLYVAVGNEFLEEATLSARSLREHMPDIPIAVVHDGETLDPVFDTGIKLNDPEYGFRDKIRGIRLSPFERTVYLDTDVYVDSEFNELFTLLDNFDLAASFNPNRDLDTRDLDVPESFPEYNTGVLVYDTTAVADLFERWANRYQDEHAHDQPSFRAVVYDSDVRMATLTREYNCLIRYPGKVVKPVKLFHGRLLDVDSPGAPKYFDVEDAASNVNKHKGHRLYHRGGRIAGFPRLARQLHLLRYSLREDGIIITARRTLSVGFRGIKNLVSSNT